MRGTFFAKTFIPIFFLSAANFNIDWQNERTSSCRRKSGVSVCVCANSAVWINKCKFEIVSETVIAGSEQLLCQLSLLNLRTRLQTIRMYFCVDFTFGNVYTSPPLPSRPSHPSVAFPSDLNSLAAAMALNHFTITFCETKFCIFAYCIGIGSDMVEKISENSNWNCNM